MSQYKDFALVLAREAGEIMRSHFGIGTHKEWKADNSPLTQADTLINQHIIDRIKAAYPEHGILGEELSSMNDEEYLWVCDPIDGTLGFSVGMPICTVSLALVHNGTVVLGVIYDPFLDRMFVAEKGQGAFLNDQPIQVSTQSTLAQAIINNDSSELTFSLMQPLRDAKTKVTRLYCITYPSVLVACGEFSAVVFGKTSTWDVAAVKVIVEEAGGKVTDIYGNEQRYDRPIKGAIISNGHLHDELISLIQKHSRSADFSFS